MRRPPPASGKGGGLASKCSSPAWPVGSGAKARTLRRALITCSSGAWWCPCVSGGGRCTHVSSGIAAQGRRRTSDTTLILFSCLSGTP